VPRPIDAEKALAFRLSGHNLSKRLPLGSLPEAAGACGVQNTPPGSAALALHARVGGLAPADVAYALEKDKTLLQVWSLRTAPHVVPTGDAAVFTGGLLPKDEREIRAFVGGIEPALDRTGMGAAEVIGLTAEALPGVLGGREMTKDDLGVELAEEVARRLDPKRLESWRSPSWYAPNQTLGESMVRFALCVVALRGSLCFGARRDNRALLVMADRWLEEPLSDAEPGEARAELVRRYLRCYGPSTPEHFARWTGTAPSQALRSWRLVEQELTEVDFEGKSAWILQRDLPVLQAPPEPRGVMILPPHDPYLAQRDRETLTPDERVRRTLWRSAGNPGAVLLDGRIVAAWRPRKKGRRLSVGVEPFAALSHAERSRIEAEALAIAPFRGADAAEVSFAGAA
jgi:hypothetical protein